MALEVAGNAELDIDSLLQADDMAQQPSRSLPSVQHLESYVLPSPNSLPSEPHSRPSQTPNAQQPTAEWVNKQRLHNYPSVYSQHYLGSDPARHVSNAHDVANGTAARSPVDHKHLYPLQPQPGQEMRSPKREIKRRTKTGCLTCRRRRIKCDEAQPTCGNCRKSKRECLGYDPIFKTTGPHGPVSSDHPVYSPSLHSSVHQLQQYTPSSQQYQPPHTYAPPLRTPPASGRGLAIDPSLAATAPMSDYSRSPIPGLRFFRKRKHTTMDDLFIADGVSPAVFPPLEPSPTSSDPGDVAEITSLWRSQYSGMLDSFFETQWYSQVGEAWLLNNSNTLKFFIRSNQLFKARQSEAAALTCLEARLIWLLAELARAAWAARQQADAQLADLLHRLDVIEHLFTGSILPPNLIPPAPAAPPKLPGRPEPTTTPEFISHSFWHHLGSSAAADDATPPSQLGPTSAAHHQSQLASSLLAMRHILSVLENRDVLYSVAVARHYAGRLERFDPDRLPTPPGTDPEHPFAKLGVALRFLSDEELGGTTAVVRSFAGLARRGIQRSRADDD